MTNKKGKKDLRNPTQRETTLALIETLKETLGETPELYSQDFKELVKQYEKDLESSEKAPKTVQKYVRNAKWFITNYTSDEEPLSKEDVIEFKSYIQTEYSKIQTINSYITTINRFIYYCYGPEGKHISVTKVKGQNSNTLEHRIYTKEFKRLYNRAKANGNMQLHYIIKIMGLTGARVNELKAFTSETILKNSVVVNNKGKIRDVPIPGDLVRELRSWVRKNKIEGDLFTLKYKQIYNGLKSLASETKIKKAKVHPHAFRHYFAFRFIEVYGDDSLPRLTDILGHSSFDTTRIYTRGTVDDYQKRMEGM